MALILFSCEGRGPREKVEVYKVSWTLSLELAPYPFFHILLSQASHEASLDTLGGGMNSLHLLIGGATKVKQKMWIVGELENEIFFL